MREKYYEQENRHAQEVKTLKSKLKKAKDSYNEYTEVFQFNENLYNRKS